MNLKDMLNPSGKKSSDEETDEFIELVAATYEKIVDRYPGKSVAWNLRITAEELNMKQDDIREILEKYYSDDAE